MTGLVKIKDKNMMFHEGEKEKVVGKNRDKEKYTKNVISLKI